ncbi:MAG: DUF4139 domain-containing protein [Phycisphaeraceae bacterium]
MYQRSLPLSALAVLLALTITAAARAQDAADASGGRTIDLPITRAVLFSSGVGYFEHTGTVEGDAVMRLMFKTDQINDVLKSMVLMDASGGQVAGVTYPANEPVGRALKSFGVDISSNPSLPEILNQLRGARVTVTAPNKITGAVLHVETRIKVVGTPPVQITEHVLTLVTDAGIKSIPMDSVTSLTLDDAKLRGELNQALAVLVSSRDTDRKPVDITFTGKGKRNVRVGYLVETPVWKTSYRLDLTDDKPFLQGWAIVENTSDQDWTDVSLSLVSGQPISFRMDLYTPLYVPRPIVVPRYFLSLTPQRYDEGLVAEDKAVRLGDRRFGKAMQEAAAQPSAPGASISGAGDGFAAQADRLSLQQGVQSVAQGGDLGELFQFKLEQPVTLPRRRSSMLPIINQAIKAERVSIYNQRVLAGHPLNGAYLTNSTKLKLLAGPVTVFDASAYAGDAQIEHMTVGERRLLSYGVDLSVTVDPSQQSTSEVQSVRIIKGVLELQRKLSISTTYRIKNKAEKERTLIIEQPFNANRKLIEPNSFEEKTPGVYRFRVPIAADTTGEFVVREDEPQGEIVVILNTDVSRLVGYANSREVPKSVKDALSRAVQLKNALTDAQRVLNELEQELAKIKTGQDRLRKNIETVGRDTPQGRRYLDKLSAEEDRIDELEGKSGQAGLIERQRQEVNNRRAALEEYLANLNVNG